LGGPLAKRTKNGGSRGSRGCDFKKGDGGVTREKQKENRNLSKKKMKPKQKREGEEKEVK